MHENLFLKIALGCIWIKLNLEIEIELVFYGLKAETFKFQEFYENRERFTPSGQKWQHFRS